MFQKQHAAKKNRPLREWQATALKLAVSAFARKGREIWVTEACPGAGKTRLACEVALALRDNESAMVDTVVVVTPSIGTRVSWVSQLNASGFNATDDPDRFAIRDFDALVISYNGITKLRQALCRRPSVGVHFVVDEYHHAEEDASWGQTVNELQSYAVSTHFLSGTGWRSTGQIACLLNHNNSKGEPYYQGDRVNADFAYTYANDLAADGDERGTLPVEFYFQDSRWINPTTGDIEELKNPHLADMDPDERKRWIEEALKSDLRVGKHLHTQHNSVDYKLSSNALVRGLIESGINALHQYRIAVNSSLPVMLIVTQNIKEAKAIYSYVTEVLSEPCSLVVSDKDSASDEIRDLQQKCAQRTPHSPNVIVSVGMISEGVDIPQIKVIVFLSAILTLLYFIQLLGRALRRIWIGDRYMDPTLNSMPAKFFAPAAPKLIAMAAMIEQQISEGRARAAKTPKKPNPPVHFDFPPAVEGIVETDGDVEGIYRGEGSFLELRRAVDAMLAHERAQECHVDRYWAEWVLSMVLSNKQDWQYAKEQIEDRCRCLGVRLETLIDDAAEVAGVELSMEQKHKIASREAESLRQRIRWMHPYDKIEDGGEAYRRIGSLLLKRSGLRCSFTEADLEGKRKWIRGAEAYIRELEATTRVGVA